MDVTAIGELLIDFTCVSTDADGYPTMAAHPGGAPANFLAALSAYGCQTALLGKVGADSFGRMLTGTLKQAGIETSGLIRAEDVFTTLAFVALDEYGNREFSFSRKPGADTRISVEELNLSLIAEAKVLHFGTLSLTDEPARSATYYAVRYARQHGKMITFDPNLRKPLWHSPEDAMQQILWGLRHSDVVKISDEEVEFLFHLSPQDGAQKIVTEYGVKLVFVTCGAKGCFYLNQRAGGFVSAPGGLHVIDTTGAGDIFSGAAIAEILRIGKQPEELCNPELREITMFACTAASLSTTKPGGISSVPSREQVVSML